MCCVGDSDAINDIAINNKVFEMVSSIPSIVSSSTQLNLVLGVRLFFEMQKNLKAKETH